MPRSTRSTEVICHTSAHSWSGRRVVRSVTFVTLHGAPSDEPRTRRAPGALPWHRVDELGPTQVAAMQSLDDARRAGLISERDFREIEAVVRAGHVYGARKRITEAKRRHAGR